MSPIFCLSIDIYIVADPSPPVNLTTTKHNITSITVSWRAPSDPNKDNYSYNITWFQLGSSFLTYSRSTNQTALTIAQLLPGKKYSVNVSSVISNGNSVPITLEAMTGIVFLTTFSVNRPLS